MHGASIVGEKVQHDETCSVHIVALSDLYSYKAPGPRRNIVEVF